MGELRQRVVKGFLWAFMEKMGVQLATFVVSMVLARLLTPSDYGTIALLTIFITISTVLAESGFGRALVQKKDATELDFNSVFYLSLVLSSLAYAALFFSAPLIARFYDSPVLVPILRVMALSLIFHAINGVQDAELSRKLLFHLSFRISLIGSLTTGIVGITLAYAGFGIWALVWATVAGGVVGVITRWYYIAWRPKWMFSCSSVKTLFQYGWKLTLSSLLDTGYNNLYGLLIGKIYSRDDLAFVNKGQSVPSFLMGTINATIGRVAFPALAQLQNRPEAMRDGMKLMLQTSTFFVFPMMTGVACCAESIIPLLFGPQWDASIPYVRLGCLTMALWPFHTINLQVIMACGRSDIFLILEIIKKVFGLTVLCLFMHQGVWMMMAMLVFLCDPFCVVVNAWPNRKLIAYSPLQQIRDVLPAAGLSAVMAAFVLAVRFLPVPDWSQLPIQILVGAIVYLGLAWMCKVSVFSIVLGNLQPFLSRRFSLKKEL